MAKSNCPSPYIYADDFSRQCVTMCPASQNTWGDAGNNFCSSTCPWVAGNYLYKDPSTQKCVSTCPVNPSLYKDNGTQFCVSYCSSPNFAVDATRECLPSCPNNFFQDTVTRKCVSDCPTDPVPTYFYAGKF